MRRQRTRVWSLLTAAALALAACGSDDTPAPTGSSMVPQGPRAEDAANAAPVIESVALSPSTPMPRSELKALAEVMDPDGDPVRISYRWLVNGEEIASGSRPTVYLMELEKGDRVEVEVSATDGRSEAEPVRVRASMGNQPPVLSAVVLEPFGDIRAGEVITASPMASDRDNDRLRFEYRWTVNGQERGRERSFDTSGLKRGDHLQVTVVADDGQAESRPVESPILPMGNTPPVITRLPALQTESGTFRYTFEAEDADGDRNLRFFLEKGPAGMRMDPITGVLTWTPNAGQAGVHDVEVGVKDGSAEGTTFLFQVTVTAQGGQAPPANASGY